MFETQKNNELIFINNWNSSDSIFSYYSKNSNDNSHYILRKLEINQFLISTISTNFQFKLIGVIKIINFEFFEGENQLAMNSELNVYRPISFLGWIFYIFTFFVIGVIFNLTAARRRKNGFILRDLLV